jgi:hypothetical protein
MAANDGTMLGWLIAMSGHKDYAATLDTKYFDESGTAPMFLTLTLLILG